MKTFENPLIGVTPSDTVDHTVGMIDLLRAVDFAGIGLTERSEVALAHIFSLMQHALGDAVSKYEQMRGSKEI